MPHALVRPESNEYAPFYADYVSRVAETDALTALETQITVVRSTFGAIPESRGGYRYAAGKWSIREIVGHLSDAERIFGYRALRFGRNDPTELPGFEENDYAAASPAISTRSPISSTSGRICGKPTSISSDSSNPKRGHDREWRAALASRCARSVSSWWGTRGITWKSSRRATPKESRRSAADAGNAVAAACTDPCAAFRVAHSRLRMAGAFAAAQREPSRGRAG
jgi:hypothetical protein